MFKEVDAKTAVNELIDGNEDVFVITHVDGNVKMARLNDFPINILVDPQLKDGYRYIVDNPKALVTPDVLDKIYGKKWYEPKPVWNECNDEEVKSDPVYHSTTTMLNDEGLAYYSDLANDTMNMGGAK